MSITSETHRIDDSFIGKMFTDPISSVFRFWVNIINFWIFVSCLSLAAETLEPFASENVHWLLLIEYVAVAFFTFDYLGNVYFARDRIKYIFSFWGLVDLISILPTFLQVLNFAGLQGTKVLRVLRVVRVLRVLKMARIALQNIINSVESANPIITNLRIYFIALFSVVMISSTLMFYVEGNLYSSDALTAGQAALDSQLKDHPLPEGSPPEASKFFPVDPISGNIIPEDKRFFTSIPASMWWCMVTLTTTGYGDMFPVTAGGRAIACVTMLLGLVLFGILLNIVGKTIMVMLFGEQVMEDAEPPAKRDTILSLMVQRNWITHDKAEAIEMWSEEEIKEKFHQI